VVKILVKCDGCGEDKPALKAIVPGRVFICKKCFDGVVHRVFEIKREEERAAEWLER